MPTHPPSPYLVWARNRTARSGEEHTNSDNIGLKLFTDLSAQTNSYFEVSFLTSLGGQRRLKKKLFDTLLQLTKAAMLPSTGFNLSACRVSRGLLGGIE